MSDFFTTYEEGTVEVFNDRLGVRVRIDCTYMPATKEVTSFSPPSLERGWEVDHETYKPRPIHKRKKEDNDY